MSERQKVWERNGNGHAMSKNVFVAMIAAFTMLGVMGTGVMAFLTQGLMFPWYVDILLSGGAFLVSLSGISIALQSDSPINSLLGYALVALPFGAIVGPVLAGVELVDAFHVLLVTGTIVVVMGTIGALIPRSLEHWAIYLFAALVLLLVGHFGLIAGFLFGLDITFALTGLEWIAVALFSFFVIYDMNRAMQVERTLDNAIDCALALYLDVLNLFVNLLGIRSD